MVKRGQARQTLQNSGGGGLQGLPRFDKGGRVAIIIYFLSEKSIHFLEFLCKAIKKGLHLTIFMQLIDPLFNILCKAIKKWPIFKKNYAIKRSTFPNFYAKRLKRFTFKNIYVINIPLFGISM